MIADLKPYPTMKDSGVPWLGEVPEHWETRRLRRLSRTPIRNGVGESAQAFRDDWPRYIRITDIASPRRLRDSGKASLPPEFMQSAPVKPGDLLLAAVGATYGKSYLHKDKTQPACFAGYLVRWSPSDAVLPEWASYWTESAAYWDQVHSGVIKSTIENFSASRYRSLSLSLPPLPEQSAIVRFLDHADRRIRRYIRAKQKLIKLLEEQKQAIIRRAVTRGLDPNVRLKPSGVEWLEDVPEHWDVVPLCAIARPRKQTNQPRRELLSVYLGRGVIPFSAVEEKRTNPTSEDLSKYQVVEPGDFVLNNQQAWRGSVGVSRHQGIVSPAYLVLELSSRLLVQFADRLLPGRAMVAQYLVCSKGVGSIQRNLYWPHLRRVAVLVPPAVEQAAIARYLDDATAFLATAIERAGREIDLLREFRTRLIADVVTGKLDVREAAARLPDEVEEPEPLDEIEAEGDTDEAGADDADAVPEEAEA